MPRKKKKAEAVQVPENLSLVFLQRRYEILMRDYDELRTLLNKALLKEVNEVKESLACEESRAEDLENAKVEAEAGLEKRFDLLVKAQGALRAVLGREDLEDSIDKYNAFRVLDDITDEVG